MSERTAAQPTVIYHMLPRRRWEAQPPDAPYRADTLATEGFIHCTAEPELLAGVANRSYRNDPGEWLVLVVEPARLSAPLRWEPAHGHMFPHVYGPLNLDAVVNVVVFPRDSDGAFQRPEALVL